jgi:Raf kinase inhibitor-like YbhB/YbcL family protein
MRCGRPVVLLAVAFLGGCGGGSTAEPARAVPVDIVVTSPAFTAGTAIPRVFTCRGADVSPPLHWAGVPPDARRLALVVADRDAPGGTYLHWVLLDVDPDVASLRTGVVPAGAHQALNSAGRARYDGPCPPSGTHHYRFTVYALRSATGLPDGADLDAALDAVDEKAVARGTLVGSFAH